MRDDFFARLEEAERRDAEDSAASTVRADPGSPTRSDTDTGRRTHTVTALSLMELYCSDEDAPRRRARVISKELDAAVRTAAQEACSTPPPPPPRANEQRGLSPPPAPMMSERRVRAAKLRQSDYASTMFWPELSRAPAYPPAILRPKSARLRNSGWNSGNTPRVRPSPLKRAVAAANAKAAAYGLSQYYIFGRQALGPSAPSTHRR